MLAGGTIVGEKDGMIEKLPLSAAVLAGGRSMRMGVDKTLLPLDGEALVARVVKAVGEVCASTLLVTNRPEDLGALSLPDSARVLTDEVPYKGPLGGLITALSWAEEEWVLAVAADMPFVSADVIRVLWSRRAGADIVVPVTAKGPEPLLALYHRRCLPVARRILESGRRRLVAVFRESRVVEVPAESLRGVDPELRSFVNVNTPAELEAARGGPEGEEAGGARRRADTGASSGEGGGEKKGGGAAPSESAHRGGAIVKVCSPEDRMKLPSERPITLHLNDREIATVQGSPRDLDEMAVGFFVAEGLVTDRGALRSIDVDHKRGLVYVATGEATPSGDAYRSRLITSGCGKGVTFSSVEHARGMTRVEEGPKLAPADVHELMLRMARSAEAYRETGGMHSCGLAGSGEVVLLREDVGRHNAVDKVLGRAWLDRLPLEEMVMLTTGRISYEMAVKAARARISLVVSRTAVTDQAADVGSTLGLTLVGYARGRRMTVYTCPHRIRGPKEIERDVG